MSLCDNDAGRLWVAQCALTALATGGFALADGRLAASAALFGGLAAVLHTWMLQRRVKLALQVARVSPGRETTALYAGAIQRFVTMLGLFIMGLGWLDLAPLPLLATFGLTQLGYIVAGGLRLSLATRTGRQVENT